MDFSKKYKLGSEKPLEVSEYINFLNEVLKRIKARVLGEISELKIDANKHVWFSLRDKNNQNVLRCVIWRSVHRMCGVELKEGMEVIVSGFSDIYPAQGKFTFKAETIEPVGEGALKKAYDELKEKLSKQGYFSDSKKRPLPLYPQKIGVVTSTHGAAVNDFTGNLSKFGFKVKIMNSRVEGQEAVKDLLSCLEAFKKTEIDVLVIIRGGGSLQSLMAFDNEMLVKEISNFPVPVIAGIGHHKDITLTALAADANESTPTATANLLNKPWEKAIHEIDKCEKNIIFGYENMISNGRNKIKSSASIAVEIFNSIFNNYKSTEKVVKSNLYKINYSLINVKRNIKDTSKLIVKNSLNLVDFQKNKFYDLERTIRFNNPERQLKLGYAIVRSNEKIVKKTNQVKKGEIINIEISNGNIESEVKNKKII